MYVCVKIATKTFSKCKSNIVTLVGTQIHQHIHTHRYKVTKRCRLQNWGTLHAVSKVNQNNWGNKRDKQRLRVKSKQEKTQANGKKCRK